MQLAGVSVIDPKTGMTRIGKMKSDDQAIDDDDMFSIAVVHEGTWEVRGVPSDKENPAFCEMDPYAYGRFAVEGEFLGIDFELLNAEGLITSQDDTPSYALLEVVGNEIIHEEAQLSLDSPTASTKRSERCRSSSRPASPWSSSTSRSR
jgi:hypothetical protein